VSDAFLQNLSVVVWIIDWPIRNIIPYSTILFIIFLWNVFFVPIGSVHRKYINVFYGSHDVGLLRG